MIWQGKDHLLADPAELDIYILTHSSASGQRWMFDSSSACVKMVYTTIIVYYQATNKATIEINK